MGRHPIRIQKYLNHPRPTAHDIGPGHSLTSDSR